MALSKKHYEQFAQVIRDERQNSLSIISLTKSHETEIEARLSALRNVASTMAVHFALDNPRFDRKRFLAACGFEG